MICLLLQNTNNLALTTLQYNSDRQLVICCDVIWDLQPTTSERDILNHCLSSSVD
jgi:serine/threonine protein phosphatase PrpC